MIRADVDEGAVSGVARPEAELVITHAAELLTLAGQNKKPRAAATAPELAIIPDGAIAVAEGKIVWVGKTSRLRRAVIFARDAERVEAHGKVVMPGFIDSHTHAVFAGSREDEFELKLKGKTYLQILKAGGGILRTVKATRRAGRHSLFDVARRRLDTMLQYGTTTVELKSGYGLTVSDEVKMLEVARDLGKAHAPDVVPTFLGAHAVPPEYKGDPGGYARLVIEEMIPKVAEARLAEFCDVFCEEGVFTVPQSRLILQAAAEHGLVAKVHADEFSPLGGAELAAVVHAASADHLLYASRRGLEMMVQAGVVACLLPATPFATLMRAQPAARDMVSLGCPLAVATDFSPNCWNESMQMVIALACTQLRLTSAEAIIGATINAAHALRRAHSIGSLEVGKKADIAILNVPNHRFLGYRFGVNLVDKVVKDGALLVDAGRPLR